MKQNGVIIQGSSNSTGNTSKIVKFLALQTGFEVIDLNKKNIGHFDYEFKNRNDDFLPLIRKIIENYQTILFATPVYWYSMSGILKVFFDRISDLLKADRELGRKLRGKRMGMISCGSDHIRQKGFSMPFYETANYLGMEYLGDLHTWIEDDQIPETILENLSNFGMKLKKSIG